MTPASSVPTATYRLQFGRQFTFQDAEALVPYLDALGVSHIYASSYLKARAGSLHGYDITDFNALNPEIGDRAAFEALAAALAARQMGQILDFVPNHMGIGKADNTWWLDVLEWGQASPFADYFDIDWNPSKLQLRGKVLVPLLGDHYGLVLERGELRLGFDAQAGRFEVWYHDHLFPITPRHYGRILAPEINRLRGEPGTDTKVLEAYERIVEEAHTLRPSGRSPGRRARLREKGLAMKAALAGLAARDADMRRAVIDSALERMNGVIGNPASFVPLHRLLERQAYRLAYWRVAADEINYRRFFDINELAGLQMERAELFDKAHELVGSFLAEGKIQGLRIDHVDGLYDPAEYLRRVATRLMPRPVPDENTAGPERSAYLVVEKILAAHETLRNSWPVDGTTGYDALNMINGLFVKGEAERSMTRQYRRFTGSGLAFDDVVYACKKLVMDTLLSSELQVLANELDQISEANWRTRDFTLATLKAFLREVAANFPVYRTYITEAGAGGDDRHEIDQAMERAKSRSEITDDSLFNFVHHALTTDLVRGRLPGYSRRAVVRFAKKFQQFTGPVMAKALEDTSFYRFFRLISLNEVGGDPRRFGTSLAAFHEFNEHRARDWPKAMTSTATHDTKRGEDARARINVLSELAEEWRSAVSRWAIHNRSGKVECDGNPAPSRNDEYFLYQTLVGAWPVELLDPAQLDAGLLSRFRERVETCVVKAAREAKLHSSWVRPNEAYEQAAIGFVRRILDPTRSAKFLHSFVAFEKRVAFFGMLNGLSQTLLKLAMPGVPDIYQGSELWDFNMVDPDNRRAVDFAVRQAVLKVLDEDAAPNDSGTAPGALLAAWPDGRIKLHLVSCMLRLRRDNPDLMLKGSYVALRAEGVHADHVCAFARMHEGQAVIVAVPRLCVGLAGGREEPPLDEVWKDTRIMLPLELCGRRWVEHLTGASFAGKEGQADGAISLSRMLQVLPVGVLRAVESGSAVN